MSLPRFDLVDIAQAIRKNIRFIFIVTVITTCIGLIMHYTRPKTYMAKADFIVGNPLVGDRFTMYGNDQHPMDYFGSDDDMDKIIMMANSDTVQNTVIRNLRLDTALNVKIEKTDDWFRLKKMVLARFDVKRTEYRDLRLSFTDKRPELAANVANEFIRVTEQCFRGYYNNVRVNLYESIKNKVHEEDSTINSLTNILGKLRDSFKIYQIMSPNRNNIMLSQISASGNGDFGKGVEEIQNIESLKDQVVIDRARHTTLMNQYSTGTQLNELPLVQIITAATPPVKPVGLSGTLTVTAAALTGFFFSIVLVLLMAYSKSIMTRKTRNAA
jgi:uncharacterized protein involved in exopolysaccharide biosynthesis